MKMATEKLKLDYKTQT